MMDRVVVSVAMDMLARLAATTLVLAMTTLLVVTTLLSLLAVEVAATPGSVSSLLASSADMPLFSLLW